MSCIRSAKVDPEQAVDDFTEHHHSTLTAKLGYLWHRRQQAGGGEE